MITSALSVWNRVYGALGRLSMYRLVLLSLAALAVIAIIASFFDVLVAGPVDMVVSLAVLGAVTVAVDALAHLLLRRGLRWEVSAITALILFFVLRPTLEPLALLGLALAAAVAAASKYLLVWRERHIFNPAAVGAAVLTIVSIWLPSLGSSSWWVGTPILAVPVIVCGLLVLIRTEKLRVVLLFVVVAVVVAFARTVLQYQSAGLQVDLGMILPQVLWASPFLFLGVFMLSEPLTLPPRRWQQYVVAVVVGVLAGWPISLGAISLGQERALLIGNLVAFAFCLRRGVRLTFVEREALTPSVRELTFRAGRGFTFAPGQYLELEVPHARPDARGVRREFSIVSAPEELPLVKIALREGSTSSYKQALAEVQPGKRLWATGVWGDFVLPRDPKTPVLLVAAGIGITPFVSQLRHLRLSGGDRDVVVVYVASGSEELAFRDDLAAAGVPVIVFTRDAPADLPRTWTWTQGARLDADNLQRAVPDLSERHAFISGPPGLIADLTPALQRARSVTTDAFAGY